MASQLIKVGQVFFTDHEERALPTPVVYRISRSHYWIAEDDPAIGELLNDAEFYSHRDGPDGAPFGVVVSARALVKTLTAPRPKGRHCAYCEKPGGQSYAFFFGTVAKAFFVHRQCVNKFKASMYQPDQDGAL